MITLSYVFDEQQRKIYLGVVMEEEGLVEVDLRKKCVSSTQGSTENFTNLLCQGREFEEI